MNEVIVQDGARDRWLHFRDPRQVIAAHRQDQVVSSLREIEERVNREGLHAAGFISYEAAPAFDDALEVRPMDDFPLLRFGLYSPPEMTDRLSPPAPACDYRLGEWTPTVSRQAYDRAIEQVKAYIARGETYQVNYSFRLRAPFSGSAWKLFHELVRAQRAEYTAYVDTGRFTICSASPELFFHLDGRRLTSRPMKGTAARGLTYAQDEAQVEWLHHSEKNRAENVMIVDMIRNDMGRVAEIGSVRVPSLFEVERYPTVWQMTSTVEATTDVPLHEIMAALFPCASITGAPKRRTMQIIAELETTPRRVYTGCVGYLAPQRQALFNVAIRTVLIDRATDEAEYGVGGGIVWDSDVADEYVECQIKARVLTEKQSEFSLLETILWTSEEGYFLLDYHLRRLCNSAAYFGVPLEETEVRERLAALVHPFPADQQKVRLLVAQNGTIRCEAAPLTATADSNPVRLKLAPTPIDPESPYLYHKTTHRQAYDAARAACPDCDDVVLWNERGEITEATIANLVVEVDGEMVTPPVECGLLPGTFRAWLLDQGEVREKVITIGDLKRSERIFVINSVRKWREAALR